MKRTRLRDRILPSYTKGEELMNMITHIVGAAMGLIALIVCVIFASMSKNGYAIASAIIFGLSMITLYTISSIYHGLSPKLTAKKVFQVIDHCAIFALIAGTYTPFLLIRIREYNPHLGWGMLALIWAMAILGIILNSIDLKKYKKFSMICYLGMGWAILITAPNLVSILGIVAVVLLVSGGLSYTLGAILYAMGKRKKYFHSVFHIFVTLGSLLHLISILIII